MFKNFVWDFGGKFSNQVVSFVISIVLTRVLSPTEFGIMGMALVVVNFAAFFLDLGFSRALIQQQEVTQQQYATVFYINIFIAVFLALCCFFLASPLANFYGQPLVRPVFQILSLAFLLNGFNLIPSSILYKRMDFRRITIFNFTASAISGISGVALALNDFGIWSLVIQTLLNSFIILSLNLVYTRWLPQWTFSFKAIKPLWAFGSRLFGAGFLDIVFTKADVFIIGKLFAPATLGYYTRAQSLDITVRNFSSGSILSVLFPFIAKNQNDLNLLKELYIRYLHYILFISIGISGALFIIAKPLFTLLFTEKWLFSAELFQIMAVIGFSWPMSSLIVSMIEGIGNSKAFLKLEVYKKLVFLPVYVFGFWFGIKGFMYFLIVGSIIAVFLNITFVSRELRLQAVRQVSMMGKYIVIAVIGVATTTLLLQVIQFQPDILKIIIGTIIFSSLFFVLCFMLKMEGFTILKHGVQKVKVILNDKRNKSISSTV